MADHNGMLLTREHYDLMAQFERTFSGRFDKEAKELWPRGIIYQDGHVNELFLTYRRGYAYGKATTPPAAQQDAPTDADSAVNQSLTTAPQTPPSLMEVRHLWDAATEATGGDGLEAMQNFARLVLARYAPAQRRN